MHAETGVTTQSGCSAAQARFASICLAVWHCIRHACVCDLIEHKLAESIEVARPLDQMRSHFRDHPTAAYWCVVSLAGYASGFRSVLSQPQG